MNSYETRCMRCDRPVLAAGDKFSEAGPVCPECFDRDQEERARRNTQEPNFRDEQGKLFLVRCFACGGERGTENYGPAVASGTCAWCGWSEHGGTP